MKIIVIVLSILSISFCTSSWRTVIRKVLKSSTYRVTNKSFINDFQVAY